MAARFLCLFWSITLLFSAAGCTLSDDDDGGPNACTPNDMWLEECPCGLNVSQICPESGYWSYPEGRCESLCELRSVKQCESGTDEVESCGDCNVHSRTCLDGEWTDWGECVRGPDCTYHECSQGQQEVEACGSCGTRSRACIDDQWSLWTECIEQDYCTGGDCLFGDFDVRACAEECFVTYRECGPTETWSEWSPCFEDTGCEPSPPR